MRRVTPDDICYDGVCWQKKVAISEASRFEASGACRFWEHVDLDLSKSVVKPITRKMAEQVIERYEWLGDMAVTNRYYGLFFEHLCAGVICINRKGVSFGNGRLFGLEDRFVSYFARGACTFWAPNGSASRLLSIAAKLEKKDGQKVCIGFSDIYAGEIGTVYQASNWICLGLSNPYGFIMLKGDHYIDDRTLSSFSKRSKISFSEAKAMFEAKGYSVVRKNPKIRYAKILASGKEYNDIYNRIKHLIIPYPKREDFFWKNAAEGLVGGCLATSGEGAFDSTLPL